MRTDEDDLDLEERQLLQQGYGDLVPSDARKEFILGALSVRLPGVLTPAAALASAGGSVGPGWLRAKQALALLGFGALGFGLGIAVSRPAVDGAPAREVTPPQVSPVSGQALAAPQAVRLSELEAESPEEKTAVRVTAATRASPEREGDGQDRNAAPTRVSFYEELSYIRRAQTALAAGNPTLALGLMRSLSELRSDGALLAERDMTEVLALCALGRDGEAEDVGRRVRARGDGSMYGSRLDKTCARASGTDDSSEDSTGAPTSTE